jgi:L-lysine exporter family protein LysE/ArgO
MHAALAGFTLGFSLILAIGAQNAFVLKQGLRREHVFWICLLCALSDAVLILLGVSGLAIMIRQAPWLAPVMRYGGAAFLLYYGARSFHTAWKSSDSLVPAATAAKPLLPTLLTCAALTWLNPHVYLDTVLLIFALGYGAALLRPVFARPGAWRVLEILVGVTMWGIALKLLWE